MRTWQKRIEKMRNDFNLPLKVSKRSRSSYDFSVSIWNWKLWNFQSTEMRKRFRHYRLDPSKQFQFWKALVPFFSIIYHVCIWSASKTGCLSSNASFVDANDNFISQSCVLYFISEANIKERNGHNKRTISSIHIYYEFCLERVPEPQTKKI